MNGEFGAYLRRCPERTRIHAARTELGGPCGIFGYKHGAADGAFRSATTTILMYNLLERVPFFFQPSDIQ